MQITHYSSIRSLQQKTQSEEQVSEKAGEIKKYYAFKIILFLTFAERTTCKGNHSTVDFWLILFSRAAIEPLLIFWAIVFCFTGLNCVSNELSLSK